MSMNNNDGGPAFPFGTKETTYDSYGGHRQDVSESHAPGMTLRDWFAGQALQGLLASGHFTFPPDGEDGAWMTTHSDPFDDETGEEIHKGRRRLDFPEAAWVCADAMIAARQP